MSSVHQQWFICGWRAGSEFFFFFYSRSKEEKFHIAPLDVLEL